MGGSKGFNRIDSQDELDESNSAHFSTKSEDRITGGAGKDGGGWVKTDITVQVDEGETGQQQRREEVGALEGLTRRW